MYNAINLDCRPLSRDEQRKLCVQRDAGDDGAIWKLAQSVMPYAVKLTKQCCKRFNSLDFDVALSSAIIGCYDAAKRLDPDRGSITTIANFSIRRMLYVEVGKASFKTISAPNSMVNDEHARHAKAVISLDDGYYNSDGEAWSNIPSSEPDPSDEVTEQDHHQIMCKQLYKSIDKLSKRDAYIIKSKYFSKKRKTNKQLGQELKVSGTRVQQLEKRTLASLHDALQLYV